MARTTFGEHFGRTPDKPRLRWAQDRNFLIGSLRSSRQHILHAIGHVEDNGNGWYALMTQLELLMLAVEESKWEEPTHDNH